MQRVPMQPVVIVDFACELASRLVWRVCRNLEQGGEDAAKEALRGAYEVLVWALAQLDGDPNLYKKGIPSRLRQRLNDAYGEDCSLHKVRWGMLGQAKWHVLTPGAKFGARPARIRHPKDAQQQQQQLQEQEQQQPGQERCGSATAQEQGSIRSRRRPKDQKRRRQASLQPQAIDWSGADPSKWEYVESKTDVLMYFQKELSFEEEEEGPVDAGVQRLKNNSTGYIGLCYETSITEEPPEQQRYSLIRRAAAGLRVREVEDGGFTCLRAQYRALKPDVVVPDDAAVERLATYHGERLAPPLCPGRGHGIADVPSICLLGDVDPSGVSQGGVGDGWLLSALAALAEYDGAVRRLFRHSRGLLEKPSDDPNEYTITLYDLASWEPVDVTVGEALCSNSSGRDSGPGLLGCPPSLSGELWPCYVEKAVAMHCGGWDRIDGGQVTHAWRLLTGCRRQYTFCRHEEGWGCYGDFNPNEDRWEALGNSPHDRFRGLWPMCWPEEGGGGELGSKLGAEEMFERMCAWDDQNFAMCCSARAGSEIEDAGGIVDGRACAILVCESNAGGTGLDLVKVRDLWGQAELRSARWADGGPGWTSTRR